MANSLKNIKLPVYSKGEELCNAISHAFGIILGIVVLILSVSASITHKDTLTTISCIIYGITMIILYSMSTIYHGMSLKHESAKKVFRVLDHCTIYLLIAGTYTPIAIGGIREESVTLGWAVVGIQWFLCLLCLTLTAIDLKKYNIFSLICYVIMGWLLVFFWNPTVRAFTKEGFAFCLSGGIMYTIGAVLYAIGKKKKYVHSVFHLFVLAGSLLQFLGIYLYILR